MEKIREYIKQNNLLESGDNLIVGLSGGADSVCLLFVLVNLSKEYNLRIHAVHINHMIRETAGRDEKFSKDLCDKEGVDFTSYKTDCVLLSKESGLSVEETGRNERYRLFTETGDKVFGKNNYKIAVAHHADDLAETFLFNLSRGTGIKGLASIRPRNGAIIRPLLCVTKEEIIDILNKNNLEHVEDETNTDEDYSRNKIRHRILPEMNEINSEASAHIVKTAEGLSEIDDYLSSEVDKVWDSLVSVSDKETVIKDGVRILHPAIRKRVLHKALTVTAGRARDISVSQTEALEELFEKQSGRQRNFIYKMTAVREYDGVHIYKNKTDFSVKESNYQITFNVAERDFSKEIPSDMYTKWMDYDKISNCPVVRFRQKGDYIYVADNARKSLSDYMINEKIPSKQRDSIPLVADGNHILWVVGYRISSAVKVSDETVTVLTVKKE